MGFANEYENCGKLTKYVLFGSNLIAFIGGLTIIGISLYSLADNVTWISELTGSNIVKGTVYILLVSGVFFTIVAFLGCYGALREIRCMLFTYFIIVSLLFVILFIGGILGFVFRETFVKTLESEMRTSLRLYDSRRDVREAWDTVQQQLHCCGVQSWRDWLNNGYQVPRSCCREIIPGQPMNCQRTPDNVHPSNAYNEGCLHATEDFLKSHALVLSVTGLLAAFLMFIGMAFSFSLFRLIE